jgi:hypothetical protein
MARTSRTSIDFPHFAPTNGSRNCERVSRPSRTPVSIRQAPTGNQVNTKGIRQFRLAGAMKSPLLFNVSKR